MKSGLTCDLVDSVAMEILPIPLPIFGMLKTSVLSWPYGISMDEGSQAPGVSPGYCILIVGRQCVSTFEIKRGCPPRPQNGVAGDVYICACCFSNYDHCDSKKKAFTSQ